MSNSLWPHKLQHARPPCQSSTPRVYPNSCPLSWWYHPTISSSVVPFFSCPQSFPASGSFQMSQPFTSGGQSILQSIGVSASTSVLPMNTQDWSLLGFRALALAVHSGELFPPRYPSPGPSLHLPISFKCPLLSSHLKTATVLLTHFLSPLKAS